MATLVKSHLKFMSLRSVNSTFDLSFNSVCYLTAVSKETNYICALKVTLIKGMMMLLWLFL